VPQVSVSGQAAVGRRSLEPLDLVGTVLQLPVARGSLELSMYQLTARVVRQAPSGYDLELVAPPAAFVANVAQL
jgi:hypothetical protein